MTKRTGFVFALVLFVGTLLPVMPRAGAQESAEKNAKEQSPADKNKAESGLSDSQVNFPQAEGPVELRAGRGTRITLKLADSSRAVYEAIGRQAKISVLFDPDYTPRPISVDLNGVPLQDALKIVAFESRTFWRPVTSDSIFVAADTLGKRREFEQQVVKTFYFPNVTGPTELQDIVNGLRTIIEVQRVQQMPFYQTITVRATPEQMAMVDKLVDDLNRAKQKTGGEYRLEFRVSESTEDKKGAAKIYTLLIQPRERGKLRIGPQIPVATKDTERTYLDAGKDIDCTIASETEHSVSVKITVEFADLELDEHGAVRSAFGNPVFQRIVTETIVTLELGTPTVISSFQDPASKHNFQIEATVTRTKSKE